MYSWVPTKETRCQKQEGTEPRRWQLMCLPWGEDRVSNWGLGVKPMGTGDDLGVHLRSQWAWHLCIKLDPWKATLSKKGKFEKMCPSTSKWQGCLFQPENWKFSAQHCMVWDANLLNRDSPETPQPIQGHKNEAQSGDTPGAWAKVEKPWSHAPRIQAAKESIGGKK